MNKEIYYLVNYYYGEMRIAVGEDELEKIKMSKDSWETVDREKYHQLERMYNAGKRSVFDKILDVLK